MAAVWGFVAFSLIGGGLDRWRAGHRWIGGTGVALGVAMLATILVVYATDS